jgi:hypothetical protein
VRPLISLKDHRKIGESTKHCTLNEADQCLVIVFSACSLTSIGRHNDPNVTIQPRNHIVTDHSRIPIVWRLLRDWNRDGHGYTLVTYTTHYCQESLPHYHMRGTEAIVICHGSTLCEHLIKRGLAWSPHALNVRRSKHSGSKHGRPCVCAVLHKLTQG